MDLTIRSMSNQKIVEELHQLSIIMQHIFKRIKFSTNQSDMLVFNPYKPGVLFMGHCLIGIPSKHEIMMTKFS